MHGIPHFAISIGLEREGQMVSGVVYNPVTDDLFTAEKGHGAFLNNKRLRVAARKELAPSVIATGLPFMGKDGHARACAEMAAVMNVTAGIRRFGSASLDLAYVAAGRFDGFWERCLAALGHGGGHPAGARGGRHDHRHARRRRDDDQGHGACANENLHPQLLKLLKSVKAP